MTYFEKSDAIYEYTKSALKTIKKAGADIGMVQIGNEINSGLAGETTTVKVTVTLAKTPVDGTKTGTINVQLNAKPIDDQFPFHVHLNQPLKKQLQPNHSRQYLI